MKNTVKLNESQLRKIVAETVKKVLKEDGGYFNNDIDYGDSPEPISQYTYLIEPMKLLLNGYHNYMWDWNVDESDISFGEYCEKLREEFGLQVE